MSDIKLVGDVGGTNARFAILDDNGELQNTETLETDLFGSLAEAITAYCQQQSVASVQQAAIAVATPVTGDKVKMTNNRWSFSIDETREQIGLERLHVVNDFTALALSVRHLPEHELVKVGRGHAVDQHAIAVIGPGTGLGVSGLIPSGSGWNALQGEGGHVSLGVRTEREFAVYALLRSRFEHVSAERFLSGPGLVNIVTALRELDGLPARQFSPAQVTEYGMHDFRIRESAGAADVASECSAQDRVSCEESLRIFCALLGSCAGNLVLTLGAEGGVYVGGGIVPRLGEFFLQSSFRQEFEAKGRMQPYLQNVPSFVIHSPYPALVGAAQLLL